MYISKKEMLLTRKIIRTLVEMANVQQSQETSAYLDWLTFPVVIAKA